MQRSFDKESLKGVEYLVGSEETLAELAQVSGREPFGEKIVEFLNALSRTLLSMPEAKRYPDVVTLAFWLRKASVKRLAERFQPEADSLRLGRGIAFHIAPSNVAVNYAYSFAAGFLTGNANLVRLPSKDFPQVALINRAMVRTLEQYPDERPYICFVRYGREQRINDVFSSLADTRIVWGGDRTIAELRKSPLGPRSAEVTFADRYSLAVIDSDVYLAAENPERIAEEFYNDTYLTDQNACTSPRLVVWRGAQIAEAKERFWGLLLKKVQAEYGFQSVQGVDKRTTACLAAAKLGEQDRAEGCGLHVISCGDNRLVRVQLAELPENLMDFRGNSGYFYEYDCRDILELRGICDDTHCQTLSYIGDRQSLFPLLMSEIQGIDRVVPIGRTMDFDLLWDGYNLYERLTRAVSLG